MEKRDFLRNIGALGLAAAAAGLPGINVFDRKEKKIQNLHKASFFEKGESNSVICRLCPRNCHINEGDKGFCKVRLNSGGELFTLNYGIISALHSDPVEKKPLYHFHPGENIFSIGSYGCNLTCKNCQNAEISQFGVPAMAYEKYDPADIVELAENKGERLLAFTYNEACVYYEFMLDTAILAKSKRIKTVLVSNGYINPEPLERLLPYIDAVNIDLKIWDDKRHLEICGVKPGPVKQTLLTIKKSSIHLEITHLVIPGINDETSQCEGMLRWLIKEGFESIPIHFSRFFPYHQMKDLSPTPPETINEFCRLARDAGMAYVYAGNMGNREGNGTFCPSCGIKLIDRNGYGIRILHKITPEGYCPGCNHKLYGIWK